MARKVRFACSRCDQKLHEGRPFCAACGYPTQWASHDEKVEWELAQYEEARVNGTNSDFERLQAAPAPVARRAAARRLSPTPTTPEPTISVREFREKRVDDVAVVRDAPPPVALPPVPEPDDNAVLIKVMRLLNARISELEARIAELESELAPRRRTEIR